MFGTKAKQDEKLVGFGFFDQSTLPPWSKIFENLNLLINSTDLFSSAEIEIVSESDDQWIVMIGPHAGFLTQRYPNPMPSGVYSQFDESMQMIEGHQTHIAVLGQAHKTPLETVLVATAMTLAIQAINLSQPMRSVLWSSSSCITGAQEWAKACNELIRMKTNPVHLWIQMHSRTESGSTDAATEGMGRMFGQSDIEIVGSARDEDETKDILTCAVLETIFRGPIHTQGSEWVTQTGVRYNAKRAHSIRNRKDKVVRLIEIV